MFSTNSIILSNQHNYYEIIHILYKHLRGMYPLLKKIIKALKQKISKVKLSLTARLILSALVLMLTKYLIRGQSLPRINYMPISEFLSPMNKAILEEVHVFPRIMLARDKFQNIIRTQHAGIPSNVLYDELK